MFHFISELLLDLKNISLMTFNNIISEEEIKLMILKAEQGMFILLKGLYT